MFHHLDTDGSNLLGCMVIISFLGSRKMKPGWINYFMNTINATFPHRDHVLINNGAPGTNLQFAATSSCLESRTPKSVYIMPYLLLAAHLHTSMDPYSLLINEPMLLADHIIAPSHHVREPHLLLIEHLTYMEQTEKGELLALKWQEVLLTRYKLHFNTSVRCFRASPAVG